MKKMMRLVGIFVVILGIVTSQVAFASGNNPAASQIIVSNISELADAIGQANSIGGNVKILVKAGVYDLSYLYDRMGLNCFYIGVPDVTISGISENREDVVLKGDAMSADAHIEFIFNVSGTNFTCENMTLKYVRYHAIQIHGENNVDNVVIKNVHFMDTYQQMLKISSNAKAKATNVYSDNGTVKNCLFEYTAGIAPNYYTCGIDGHHCKDWTIKNCTVKNIISPDDTLTEPAIHMWDGSIGMTVKNCTVTNCERGIYFGMGRTAISGGEIMNNIVDTMKDVSIGIENAPDTIIKNNICYTRNYPNSIEYRWPATTGVQIINNQVTGAVTSRNGAAASVISGNITIPLP